MDRRSATPEELPPLELSVLRELDLEEPAPGRAAHISAASGVARRGDFVYVIGDDELGLGVFRLSKEAPGALRPVLSGELSAEPDRRKKEKPDLEALTLLPPFTDRPFGSLLGLGSGSKPQRERGFVWGLAADGSLEGEPIELDLSPLYERLRESAPELNIEGASALGDRIWLFHRGNTEQGLNIVVDLPLTDFIDDVQRDGRIGCEGEVRTRVYELGELDGVPLTFSDATPLADELVVFTASAEPGSDPHGTDGEIRGSVVGMIDGDGQVNRLRTIDRKWKVEGVYASIDARVMDFLFVCDQDDPAAASPLLSAAMPLESRFEPG
ncbi:MAG: hypothetical protein H0V29_02845 [Thermoleophilaceae bacterium]|nr:hypothetical protein [Thermoleophilaceae bacterium]